MPLADLYRPAIHDDRRAVVPHRRHRTARHILVTPGQGYVPVIVLGLDIIKKRHSREHARQKPPSVVSHRRTSVT